MFDQTIGCPENILGAVLSVSVCRHDTQTLRELANSIIEASFESRALTKIDHMAEQMDTFDLRNLGEDRAVGGAATVIDHHYRSNPPRLE